jgi:hypothetical protein
MASANDLLMIAQKIEGIRWVKMRFGTSAAPPVTISFWVWATVAGAMSVTIKSGDSGRCYTTPVTINSAQTWVYKSVTIPGCTDGTWAINNTAGAMVVFAFGCGTTYVTAPNVWTAADKYAQTGVTNFFGTVNNEVWLTGVTVLPGSAGPTAAQSSNIKRPMDLELLMCKRYWERVALQGTVNASNYAAAMRSWVPKRVAPTATYTDNAGNPDKLTMTGQHNVTVSAGGGSANADSAVMDIVSSITGSYWLGIVIIGDARM